MSVMGIVILFICLGTVLLGVAGLVVNIWILKVAEKSMADFSQKRYEEKSPTICPYCNSLNQPQYRFCVNCGGDLNNAAKKMI